MFGTHTRSTTRLAIAGSILCAAIGFGVLAISELRPAGAEDAAASGKEPKAFDSKEDAAKALIEAAAKNDDAALKDLAGDDEEDVVQDGKDPQVKKDRAMFAAAATKKLRYEEKDGNVTLVVGDEEWPFPIPLVQEKGKWVFDADEGRDEILARRIGQNELRAIRVCREYVEAQVEYASKDRDGDGVREYAQRLASTPGTHDGLWWPAADGEEQSPVADELAPLKAYLSVDAGAAPAPFMGYFWRVLTNQGPGAPGGAYSYVINGNMIAGFALIGVPASYRKTSITSLMVSNHGTVYQRDLGPDSLRIAAGIETFDPQGWTPVPAPDLSASAR